MQPLEILTPMDDSPNDTEAEARDPVAQLEIAYKRSEAALTGSEDELLAEAIRRAEAILFVSPEPLSAEQITEILPHGTEAATVLMALKAAYAGRGVELIEVAGKWRFQTALDMAFLFVEERQVQKKLSQASLETLAIIAYGQPATRAEIEAVRGVAVSKTTLDTLMETGWVRTCGQRKTPGQPMTYGTSDLFLEHFGLESLDVLPGKADLEAEGLLSDALPDDFRMPGEEGLAEDEAGESDDLAEEDANFITDFMEEDESDDEVSDDGADIEVSPALAEGDIDAAIAAELEAEFEAELETVSYQDATNNIVEFGTQDTVTEDEGEIEAASDEALEWDAPVADDAPAEIEYEIEPAEDDVASAVIALAKSTSDVESPTARETFASPENETFKDEKTDWEDW